MDIKTYCKEASRTTAKLENKTMDNLHMLLGMLTEVGELADVFKKNIAYGKEIDWVNLEEEVGDVMWYLANFCSINDFDLEKILETNIQKLRARYPEKFTYEKAVERDLKRERTVLEQGSVSLSTNEEAMEFSKNMRDFRVEVDEFAEGVKKALESDNN